MAKKLLARWMILLFVLTGCAPADTHRATAEVAAPAVKNVILVIADGMGPQQVGLLLSYARQAPRAVIPDRLTALDNMMQYNGVTGISLTYPATGLVVDSAASATQLASGRMAGSEMLGIDQDGNPVENMIERAQRAGKATGLVSDTRITHATPAGFAVHIPQREAENDIAVALLETGPDVMLSGGLRHFVPQEANDKDSAVHRALTELTGGKVPVKSKRKDSLNLLDRAQEKGYALVFTKEAMETTDSDKILGLFKNSAMSYAIDLKDQRHDPRRAVPTVKEMTAKALETLSKNENGFFLMVEVGLLDWVLHYNDAGAALHELLVFNEVVDYALQWAKSRNDTLLIVTGDHETGGFGFSYAAAPLPAPKTLAGSAFQGVDHRVMYNYGDPAVLDKLYQQKISYEALFYNHFDPLPEAQRTPAKLTELVNAHSAFPITEDQAARILATEANPYRVEGHKYLDAQVVPQVIDFKAFYPYPLEDNRFNLLAREVAEAQTVVWSTGSHTNTPCLVFASGPAGATQPFSGILHHRQVGERLIRAVERP